MNETEVLLKQIEPIEQLYKAILSGDDQHYSDRVHQYYTMCKAFITRVTGSDSVYIQRANKALENPIYYDHDGRGNLPGPVRPLYGIVQALQSDIEHGYMSSLRELIHANLFSDFLEMGQHLLNEGYKDPAAVLAGGVLEGHLRKLCQKHGIDIEETNNKGELRPKTANALSSDLYKANVYNNMLHQQVTAWLALRNAAAHGNYGEYDQAQVRLFVDGLSNFIISVPA